MLTPQLQSMTADTRRDANLDHRRDGKFVASTADSDKWHELVQGAEEKLMRGLQGN